MAPLIPGWMIRREPESSRKTACLARRDTSTMRRPLSPANRRRELIRYRTSEWKRRGCLMSRPVRAGRRSRTMVSTSGSSGTFRFPPGDVAAVDLSLEGHGGGEGLAGHPGRFDVSPKTGGAEDPAASHG